jgi:hypothetical protein
MAGMFGILESSSTQLYQDIAPTQDFFSFLASIVYAMKSIFYR